MPTTRNIIVGAAALYLSDKDSSSTNPADYDANGDFIPTTAPAGTAGTTITGTTAGNLDATGSGWRNVGYTTDGMTLSYEPTYSDVEVDQLLDSAKVFKSSMRVTLATSFVEAALKNLLVVWGQGSDTLSSTATEDILGIGSGALGDDPIERSLVAVGPAPKSLTGKKRERVYYARRVLSVDTSATAVRRAEATVFPVTFRLLPTAPNGTTVLKGQEYGIVRDRNVA